MGKKSIFRKDWYEKSIGIFVKYILDCNGNFLNFSVFVEKHNVRRSFKDFKNICRVIPASLVQLISDTHLFSDVTTSSPVLKVNNCNLTDVKCNNKLIKDALKQKIYHDYNIQKNLTWIINPL